MATKPPPLPPDARRPTGSHATTEEDEPDTDPDNPRPGARRAARVPDAARAAGPAPPAAAGAARPRPTNPNLRPRPSWSRRGARRRRDRDRDRDRDRQPLRRRLLLLAAALLRLRGAVRARPPDDGRLRHVHLFRGDAADAARHRDVSRGGRDDDRDARRGRDAAGRAGQRAARDPAVRQVPAAARPRVPGRRGPPLLRAPGHRLPRHRARADREPARRRDHAGRIDHHAAGGEVVPDRRSGRCSERSGRRSWRGAWSGTSRSARS